MGSAAGFLPRTLAVVGLCTLAHPACAAYYSYQGTLQIQGTLGQGCQGIKPLQPISLTLRDDAGKERLQGYLQLTDLLSIQRIRGSSLGALQVDLTLGPGARHPDYQLQLQGEAAALSGGQLQSSGGYDGISCFIEKAVLKLAPVPIDPAEPVQHQFEQDAAFFAVSVKVGQAATFTEHKQHTQAIALLLSAATQARASLGSQRPVIVQGVLVQLAQGQQQGGDYAGAAASYRQALAISESRYGHVASENLGLLQLVGRMLEKAHQPAAADEIYRREVADAAQSVGEQDVRYAKALADLGSLLMTEGHYFEAEPLFRQTLAIEMNANGASDQQTASALNNLANALVMLARYSEAEPLYRSALATNEQKFGSESAPVAVNLINLALLEQDEARYADAELLLQRALKIEQQVAGDHSEAVASVLDQLGNDFRGAERYQEAEPLYRQALAIDEQISGREQLPYANDLHLLGLLLYSTGRYGESEPLLRESLGIYQKVAGENSAQVAALLGDLAWLLRYTGRRDEAEAASRRALAIEEQDFGPDHPQRCHAAADTGGYELVTNRYDQAQALDQRALAIRERCLRTRERPGGGDAEQPLQRIPGDESRSPRPSHCCAARWRSMTQLWRQGPPATRMYMQNLGRAALYIGQSRRGVAAACSRPIASPAPTASRR